MRRKIVKLFTFGLVEILFLSGMLTGIAVVQAQSDDGLMVEWHFDEGSGGVVRDSSGNGNDGVIQGATRTEGKVGKALGTSSQWSGKWEGTTSEGWDVSFIVAETLVYDFTIKYATVCNGERRCCYTFTVGFPFEIVQNVFQYESYHDWPVMGKEGTWIYGEFTSPSFATGTFRRMWQEQQGKITCDKGTITWNATRKETLVTPIQSKIDSAKPGDIIIIEDGIYNENVKVNKRLTIRSRNGYDKTIIQAAISGAPIFNVTTDYVNISGFTVKGAKSNTGIYLHNANYCNISNNTCSYSFNGIELKHSNNNSISNNVCSNNKYVGIYHEHSNNNSISGNVCSNNTHYGSGHGIVFDYSNNNRISNNTCSNNKYGIYVSDSNNNSILNNHYCSNKYGIEISGANNNTISNNTCSNNRKGILLCFSASNNRIFSNICSNNTKYGIHLESSNNKIYLNNFIDNFANVNSSMMYYSGGRAVVIHKTNIWISKGTIFYTYNGTNYTNYLGNYWDDYTGNDADGDGIGDTPYDIDSDNKDNYPLMEPWENYFAPAPSVFEYTFEDFNDMITVTDTGFNDFSGNMGIVNKDGVPYIEAPLNISSLSQDEPGGSLRISYDFTKGDDEEAFAGIFMSLFGLTETQGTFDGETVEVIDFSNYTIDFKNIFGELQETPKDVEYVRFYVKGYPAAEDKIILRVELKDNKGSTAYYRVSIPNINEGWQEVEIPIESFIRIDNVDLHHMKHLNFIIERNNYAGNIHNPDKGTFYLDNIRFVDSDDSPKYLNEMSDDQFLDLISKRAFQYFLDWSSKDERSKGLIPDRSTSNDLLTIGGTGFYLTAMPIGVERGWISREEARRKVKETLEILADDRLQGPERMGKIGYRGFFYHFLGIDGKRKVNFDYPDTPENESLSTVELSTIDTTLCLYGVLTCKEYFNGSHPDERAIRDLADHIYKRVDWDFMLEPNSSQFYWGWKPNEEREGDPYEIPDAGGLGCYSGTIEYPATVDYYTDEAYLISLLAIGSPDHPVSPNVYCSWIRETDGRDFVKSYPGSLFTYFFASLWINTEEWGTDACSSAVNWYENSQKAILSSHNHCIVNRNFSTYGENSWGLTACEGPDDAYRAYGARPCALNINSQVDEDGTIAPYGAGSVITFGDEIANYSVLALKHYYQDTDLWRNRFGLGDAYNLNVSKVEGINGRDIIRNTGSWCNHVGFAIDNGPLLIAIENYRSGLIWDLIRKNKYIRSALDKGYSIFTRECEYPDEYTVGCMIWRGGAHGSKVHGQFGCGNGYSSAKDGYVKYNTTELYSAEHLYLVLRYSKHSPSTTPIKIFLDEETKPRSSFIPENQGSWNKFAETDPIDLGKITEGTHTIKFSTEGQSYGVADLDKFTLSYLSK